MNDLYNRQETLDLDTTKNIVIIGVGGVGWSTAKYLAMAGVDNITLFDDDVIEIHNLPRLDVPMTCIGRNKSDLLAEFIKEMRPDSEVVGFPFKFNPDVIDLDEVDLIIDCTDIHTTQIENKTIAEENDCQYVKIGYNGTHLTITKSVDGWDVDDAPDGYTVVPSYISPAAVVAGLAVNMILNNDIQEVSCNLNDLYTVK